MPPNAKRGILWSGISLLLILSYLTWSRENYLLRLRSEQVVLGRNLQLISHRNRELRRFLDELQQVAAQKKSRHDLEDDVSRSRKLSFRDPVQYRTMRHSDLRNYILSKMLSLYSPEEFRGYEMALKRIGLLPRGFELKDGVADLLSDQIAAFYDPDEHKLYTLDEIAPGDPSQRMVLAHELVHVLQDQNFGLDKLPLRDKANDDAALAAAALIEGDASYHMQMYMIPDSNQNGSETSDSLRHEGDERLRSAPPYLRESLIFPYREGCQFVAQLYARSGNGGLDAAFANPPQSTEQILHPEKYLGPDKDPPKRVDFVIRQESGWKKICENVVGELGIRALFFELYGAEKAAQIAMGWGGDHYELFEIRPNQWVFVWKTVWDTQKDARKFFEALEGFYRDRYGSHDLEKRIPEPEEKKKNEPIADSVFFSVSHQKQNITIQDKTVWFLDAPDIQIMKRLLPELNSK